MTQTSLWTSGLTYLRFLKRLTKNDLDWFRAVVWAALGVLLGPALAWALWDLKFRLYWPSGEAAIAAGMEYLFGLPFVLLLGVVGGVLGGFLLGLFYETILGLLNHWLALLYKRSRRD